MFCPGADTFQGVSGGGGCDFEAPFGPAACDSHGMSMIINIKVSAPAPQPSAGAAARRRSPALAAPRWPDALALR
jgi:hypothetical protein